MEEIKTEKDMNELLKDISAKASYGPLKADFEGGIIDIIGTNSYGEIYPDRVNYTLPVDEVKPYLRPMSSMTEEEKKELSERYVWRISCRKIQIRYHSEGSWDDDTDCPTEEYLWLFDWLDKNRFDYRGFIEKGFALEAKEGMYGKI